MTEKSHRIRKKHPRRGERKTYPLYPNHLLRVIMVVMGTLAVIATLSAIFPLPLDRIADPLAQPDPGIRALWLLKPAIALNMMMPIPGLTAVLIAFLAVLFVLLPVLDRSGQRSIRRRILVAIPFILWMLFLAGSLVLLKGLAG